MTGRHPAPINRRHRAALVALLLMVMIIHGCGKPADPVRLGFVGGLTGRTADLGTAGRNGVMLAVDTINAAGGIDGRSIELITEDDRQDPDAARRAVRSLIALKVAAIIGPMTSTMAIATVPLANRAGVLMISPTTSSTQLSDIDDYFIRIMVPNTAATAALAVYAFEERGVRRAVAVYDLSNKNFTQDFMDGFESAFRGRADAVQFRTVSFHSGKEPAFAAIAADVLAGGPQAVLLVANAQDAAVLCQQIRHLSSRVPILSSGWAYTMDFIRHGGPAVEGVVFPQWYDGDATNPAFIRFKARYVERFGTQPNFASAFAYEAALVFAEGMAAAGAPANLKKAILDRATFDGLQGPFRFNRFGDPQRRFFLLTVRGGQFEAMK